MAGGGQNSPSGSDFMAHAKLTWNPRGGLENPAHAGFSFTASSLGGCSNLIFYFAHLSFQPTCFFISPP